MTTKPWWEEAVFYQICPRSFCDSTGNGVGDLNGITARLDYICALGVDALFVSAMFPSPMVDFGYDVSEYCGVDPLFGSLDDLDRLIATAHSRGLRVLLDWIPNHTSDQHPWFADARTARDSRHRDWYLWRDDRPDQDGGSGPPGSPGRAPNNWMTVFPGEQGDALSSAWTWDARTGQWYLHLFSSAQPDLNWANPEVQAAMAETLRFWLDRGTDGFRVDVAQCLGKDPLLADLPAARASQPAWASNDRPETHAILAEVRRLVAVYGEDRLLLGEIHLPTTAQVARYHGCAAEPEMHLAFNYPPLLAPWDATAWRQCIDDVRAHIEQGAGAWPTWVLSNPDFPRPPTRYGSDERARAAAVLLLTLRGTPFLFAGEELGLHDAVIAPDQQVDPGGRDGARAPIPWTPAPDHGWVGGARPWLPWPEGTVTGRDAASEDGDPSSFLTLYRRLLAVRKASPALRHGHFAWALDGDVADGVLAFTRSAGDDERLVVVNFTSEERILPVAAAAEGWRVEVDSLRAGEAGSTGPSHAVRPEEVLRPDQALVLRADPRP
jgi:alpha-glucosidase